MRILLATLLFLLSPVAYGAYPDDSVCAVSAGGLSSTGFVVAANDKELLCRGAAHAIPGSNLSITWPNGVKQAGKVVASDPSTDSVAFVVPNQGEHLPLVLTDTKGSSGPFTGLGLVHGVPESISGAFVGAQPGAFAISGTNEEGTSGGPVFNKTGQVAGAMVGSTTGPNGKTLAVSGQQLQKFLAQFAGGVVPVGDLTADPTFRLTALRECNRQVCAAQQNQDEILNQPPRFNFPQVVKRVFNDNDNNVAVLENQILALRFQLQQGVGYQGYQQPAVAPTPGDKGPEGAQGPQGKVGEQGPPGDAGKVEAEKVDYTKIWAWLRDHKDEFTVQPATPPAAPATPPPITKPTGGTTADTPIGYYDIQPKK